MIHKQQPIWPVILNGLKKNVIPGLIIQTLALGLVLSYYLIPSAKGLFDQLGGIKARWGFLYSSLSTALFGGILPFVILLVMNRTVPGRRLGEVLFLTVFWGYKGIEIDLLYRLMGLLFGTEPSFLTVLPKVLIDQFVYGPLWAGPTMTIAYLWKDNGFSLKRCGKELKQESLFRRILTVWASSLVVWIPAVSIIYSLPANLQIPLFNLILCFFALILAVVARGEREENLPSTP